jgi:hypothetical protein
MHENKLQREHQQGVFSLLKGFGAEFDFSYSLYGTRLERGF